MKKYIYRRHIGHGLCLLLCVFQACWGSGYTQKDPFYPVYWVAGKDLDDIKDKPKELIYVHGKCTPNQIKSFVAKDASAIFLFQATEKSYFPTQQVGKTKSVSRAKKPFNNNDDKEIAALLSRKKPKVTAHTKNLEGATVYLPHGAVGFNNLPPKRSAGKKKLSWLTAPSHSTIPSIIDEQSIPASVPLKIPTKQGLQHKRLDTIHEEDVQPSASDTEEDGPNPLYSVPKAPVSFPKRLADSVPTIILLCTGGMVLYGLCAPSRKSQKARQAKVQGS